MNFAKKTKKGKSVFGSKNPFSDFPRKHALNLKFQFFSVPSAPPTSVQGFNTSATSIFVSWGEVPLSDQNGVILSYTVTYEALPPLPGSKLTKTVSAPNTSITLKDLNEFTDYNITVFASTVKGGGTISTPFIVRTDEDSKYTNSHIAMQRNINVYYFKIHGEILLSLFKSLQILN